MNKNFIGVVSVTLGLSLLACASDSDSDVNDDVRDDTDDTSQDDSSGNDDASDAGTDDTSDDDASDAGTDDTSDDDDAHDDDVVDAGSDEPKNDMAANDSGVVDAGGNPDSFDAGMAASDGGGQQTDADSPEADAATNARSTCLPPIALGTYAPTDGDAAGFAVEGDLAYVAARSAGVYVVDISDPAAPVELGQYDFPSGNLAFDVSLAGDRLAVALRGNGWALLDVSDVAQVSLLASDDSANAHDVELSGNVLFFADGNGVQSVDSSDPEAPMPLTTDLVLPGSSRELIVDGSLIYVGSAGAGISIVDAADPGNLLELASLDVGMGAPNIVHADGVLYAAHSEGVAVIDVSDPTMPSAVGAFTRDRAHDLALLDQHLFVFGDDTSAVQVPFVSIIDVSDPSAPVAVGAELDTFESPVAAHLSDGRLYVSVEDDDSLHIFEACPQNQ